MARVHGRKHKVRKKMNSSKKGSSNFPSLLGMLVVTLIIFGGVIYWRFGKPVSDTDKKEASTVVTVTPTPTPIPLPSGPVKYTVSQSKHTGPTFVSVTFDPLDAKKNKDLTITTSLTNTSPITGVKGTLATDNGRIDLNFSRVTGTDMNGEWRTTIRLNDTVLYTYLLTLTASSSNGTSSIKASPR